MDMKKYTAVFLSAWSLLLAGAPFEATLEVNRGAVRLGEYIQLVLTSNKQPGQIDYPVIPDARWAKNIQSSGSRYINGKVSHIRTLYLAPEKEGTVVIPPFKVFSGKESVLTGELKVRVLPRRAPVTEDGKTYKLSDIIKTAAVLLPAGKEIYAGEEMTLQLDLLVDERFADKVRLSYYPELTGVENALFTMFDQRGGKVRFRMVQPRQVVEKDNTFVRYRFTALCRVLKPGQFAPGASLRVGIVQNRSRQTDPFDDFFGDMGGFFSSTSVEPYTVTFQKMPEVTVKALPPVPAGTENTCLVGKWQISGQLSSSSLRQGEVCELTLSFQGQGATENFHAPKVDAPGFRVYPPEVQKKVSQVTVKYALIPLEPGEKNISCTPAFFDPVTAKWQSFPLSFKAAVAKAAQNGTSVPVQKNFSSAQEMKEQPRAENAPASRLVYQKKSPGQVVKVPLSDNTFLWILLFALGCPVAAVILELFFLRREKEANSPELQQKRALKKELKAVAQLLKEKGDTPEVRNRLVPLLGEALGLSAGASASEIAARMSDQELCAYFSQLDLASYRPDGGAEGTMLSASGKKALLKLLKTLCLFFVLCFALPGEGAGLNEAFNKGEFKKAAQEYWAAAKTADGYRPDLLYNYGNARYHLNDLPEARWALTLASLLKPWDGEIRANLHLVNAQLFQHGQGSSFGEALKEMRDHIRCDHYLLGGAVFWGLLWLVWSFRRKFAPGVFYSCCGVLVFFCLLCLLAFGTQKQTTYAPERVMVTASSAPLRTLPGKSTGAVDTTLTGGSEGVLVEKDPSGFARVRINGREGWVALSDIKSLF